jgi:hypothetical protein
MHYLPCSAAPGALRALSLRRTASLGRLHYASAHACSGPFACWTKPKNPSAACARQGALLAGHRRALVEREELQERTRRTHCCIMRSVARLRGPYAGAISTPEIGYAARQLGPRSSFTVPQCLDLRARFLVARAALVQDNNSRERASFARYWRPTVDVQLAKCTSPFSRTPTLRRSSKAPTLGQAA